MSHLANDKILDYMFEQIEEEKYRKFNKLNPKDLINYLYDKPQKNDHYGRGSSR